MLGVGLYRHIAASRLHELSTDEVVLDSEELIHLEICQGCQKLLERFVERARRYKEPQNR